MTPAKINPCLEGLSVDCFKHNPQWAKQAFAYRLLHTLTPKQLTRRLPKGLRIALLAPGVVVPPGVELPPGTTVPPGATIPTTWTPEQPPSPGTQPPPTVPPGAETTGTTPPTYTEPFAPGPVHPGIGVDPPPGANWEAQFDNTIWEMEVHVSQPTWDGSKWTITDNSDCVLEELGTWVNGYRPTKVRLSLSPTSATIGGCQLEDTAWNWISSDTDVTHLQEVDIAWQGADIRYFHFGINNNGINITNIEFLP